MPNYKQINLEQMKKIVDSQAPVVIIDARTPKWDDGRRIPSALSMPADMPVELFAQFLPNKDKPLIIYCGGGNCPAARILCERLIAAGYSDVTEYAGGIKEWSDEKKYPVELAIKSSQNDCGSNCEL